jgi:hypothetical protein
VPRKEKTIYFRSADGLRAAPVFGAERNLKQTVDTSGRRCVPGLNKYWLNYFTLK